MRVVQPRQARPSLKPLDTNIFIDWYPASVCPHAQSDVGKAGVGASDLKRKRPADRAIGGAHSQRPERAVM